MIAVLIHDDDWEGLYLDDELVLQTSIIYGWHALDAAHKKGEPVEAVFFFEISMEDLDLGDLPASLQTLYDMGAIPNAS